jgi:hypothetical protein
MCSRYLKHLNHKTNCLFVVFVLVFVGVISLKFISNKVSLHVDIVILPNETSDAYRAGQQAYLKPANQCYIGGYIMLYSNILVCVAKFEWDHNILFLI